MVSSYTPNKRIEKPANGDYNNTWSTPVNSDWDIIDRAFGGTTTLNAVAASGTVALTANQYQAPIVAITGALTANVNYQLPAGVGGFWFVFNNTSGSFSILFSSAGGGSTITLAQGRTTAVICDGTNVGLANTSVPSAAGSTTQVQYNLSGQLAGSSGFVFDGSGNVGIGTATPEAKLDMTGGQVTRGDASGYVYFAPKIGTTPFGVNYDRFEIRVDPGNPVTILGNTHGGTGVARALAFLAGTDERMRITAAGNVGIGQTNPASKLDVNGVLTTGNITARGDGSEGGQITFNNAANSAGPLTLDVDGTGNGRLFTTVNNANLTLGQLTGTGGVVVFYTAANERFRILATGGITSSDLPNAVGYKGIPQSTNTTAAVGDIGKHIYVATSVTINASVFSAGDSFIIVNSNTATTSINIVAGAGVTLRLAGTTTSGTPRPILPNGMASVLCVVGGASPVFLISGAGVT
jgi:hypothetical protein